ncbi:ABC transporter permease [Streptomyces sp. NPDC050418]|uniref:ABC transporter permease n=1 Tax=Streptomyces sp. NPDC050418 TaxID=3365612 RepID=UPI0037A41116
MSAPTLDRPLKSDTPGASQSPGAVARVMAHPKAVVLVAVLLLVAVTAAIGDTASWPKALRVDVESPLDDLNAWLNDNRTTHPLFLYFLLHISNFTESSADFLVELFEAMGWIGVTVVATLGSWAAGGADLSRRALRTAATALGVFVAVGVLGLWAKTMETLALMTVAVIAAALLGLLLGLAAGLSDRCERLLRPVFDTMQIMPALAYLLPLMLVFGIGTAPALISTVIYAAPPMARLTSLGLRSADPAALEAATSLGASGRQRLLTAQLPLARKSMMLGLNQTIMMSLSMVVLASLIGAGGLGNEIYRALNSLDVGSAIVAGTGIVLVAVLLDRTTAAAGERIDEETGLGISAFTKRLRIGVWALFGAVFAVFATLGSRIGAAEWPAEQTVSIGANLQSAVDWVTEHLGSGIPLIGGTLTWGKGFAEYVLNPVRSTFLDTPWWALVLLVAALGWVVGTWRAALSATACLAVIGVLGLWDPALDTLSQVLGALLVTVVLGVLTGIAAHRLPWLERLLRPVLDVMQTMPQFVYLIPAIALLGLGRTTGVLAAVVFAVPAVIRITTQSLKQVDPTAVEAAVSLGATSRQQLLQVQLPLARRGLLVGVNQGVVLVLSMVVIGGMTAGGALGYDVVYALAKSDLGLGLPAGIAIVCLGIMLDRLSQPRRR